ncbi:hypothetical protein MBLNU230_g3840t1 [Neophaeotheca triangularis]
MSNKTQHEKYQQVPQDYQQNKLQQPDCEPATLNPRKHQPPSSGNGFKNYWLVDLHVNTFVEAQLLLLTFAIGIQDAISYPDFHCFASNQTGNTVVLAVALAGQAGTLFDATNTGVSLGAFLAGAMFTGHLGTFVQKQRRAWQVAIALAQTLMVAGSAWIQYVHGTHQSGAWARAALALLAFASGSQVAAARAFKIPEITTAMATAAWVDFLIDEDLFARHNRPRNRRALFLTTLVAGSFAGAYTRKAIGSPDAIMISAAVKMVVIVAMLISPGEREEGLSAEALSN